MSRLDRKIGGPGDQAVDAAEILAALAKGAGTGSERRRNAVSRYLSGSDGWEEASEILGGAFAAKEAWLRGGKDE